MHSRVIWSHQFMYVAKKLAVFKVLPLEDLSLVQSVARSSSLTAKKGAYYARWRKKFGSILLTGWESVPGNCTGPERLIYNGIQLVNYPCTH